MRAWSVVRSLGTQRTGNAAKKANAEMRWKDTVRKPSLDKCYFKSSSCRGKHVVANTAIGPMRVCKAHLHLVNEYKD